MGVTGLCQGPKLGDGQDVREKKPTSKWGRSTMLPANNSDNAKYKMSYLPLPHHLQMQCGSGHVQAAFELDLEKWGVSGWQWGVTAWTITEGGVSEV